MTRGVIMTCGTSVLEARLPPRGAAQSADAVREVLHARWGRLIATDPVLAALVDPSEGAPVGSASVSTLPSVDIRILEREFLGAASEAVEGLRPGPDGGYGSRLRPLGVEAESLIRRILGKGPDGTVLGDGARIALLVSETSQGLASGLVIATLIGRGVRVWWDAASASGEGRSATGHWVQLEIISERSSSAPDDPAPVDIFVIKGLTVEGDAVLSELRSCAVALSRALNVTVPSGGDRIDGWKHVVDVEVELSGGYKAVLPLVHSLLGYFSTFVSTDIGVFLRHERSPDSWIPSTLRRLGHDEVRRHLRELRQVRESPSLEPGSTNLRGFGWIDRHGRRELTPEGTGLLELQQLL